MFIIIKPWPTYKKLADLAWPNWFLNYQAKLLHVYTLAFCIPLDILTSLFMWEGVAPINAEALLIGLNFIGAGIFLLSVFSQLMILLFLHSVSAVYSDDCFCTPGLLKENIDLNFSTSERENKAKKEVCDFSTTFWGQARPGAWFSFLDYGKDESKPFVNFSQQYQSQEGGVDSYGLALLVKNSPVLWNCNWKAHFKGWAPSVHLTTGSLSN